MTLIVAVFVFVFAAIAGSYWLVVVRPEQATRRVLRKRLLVGGARTQRLKAGLLKEAQRLSAVGPLHAVLTRWTALTTPLQRLIRLAGLRLTLGTLLLAAGCAGIGAFLLVTWMTRQPLLGLPAAAVAALLPYWYVRFTAARRMRKFEEQFPEAVDLIARALRAGHAFTTGLTMVADELPDPVGGEFRLLYDRQNFGQPLAAALREFAERIPVLDARFFATAVLTQREAGGNLSEVLDNLASVIRERFRVKRQVRVVSAHGRITGWVLAGMPPALAFVFLVVSPKHIQTLVGDPLGVQMLMTAGVLQILGTLIIRRIVRIEY